ncbi:hypothetical protein [Alkalicoccobacillus murimartini]|uniref:Uncharacterized protein n=1 Tax=Alkalicoccobacillus murimartini TaxID=171685 RepID=A0ABT9YE26_9BACI|nr:hypothetical protein [Alkalicoccobacillus murimartini]MDQ0205289.1 hypothetical protein [Alkalicoccobacillus murimartini]
MWRFVYGLTILLILTSCQGEGPSNQNQMQSSPSPAKVQSIPETEDLVQELTLQVVYDNGEEVRVHYVQGDQEQWVYHNDLLSSPEIHEDQLSSKIEQLTIDKSTLTEEAIQQMRYVFEFNGVYDVLDLTITYVDGTTNEYNG